MKIAVLASGGLDSVILIHYLLKKGERVQPIYIKMGHIWEKAELRRLKQFLKRAQTRNLKPLVTLSLPTEDLYQHHWSLTGKNTPGAKSRDTRVYLPGKNLLLIGKASVFCATRRIHRLALGPLKNNPFPDARPSFFKCLEQVSSKALNFNLKIKTPFLGKSKEEVMAIGRNLPLHLTFSCLAPKGLHHCGRCNKCTERKKAFRLASIPDVTPYAH
ncbi:MAG: 7-cyano-7-deazaguanine synthase [Candidatus Omnitrophica bacterium]|nr:7-cyano-7-deazaguanine synthase [Candidatus Omnitrophota bacterium]